MNPRAGELLFDNDRPTVLYTPHFRPALSSWPKWGMAVLDLFANSNRYNLIRSEEHTSELQSLMRISYAVFCSRKKTTVPRLWSPDRRLAPQQRYTRSGTRLQDSTAPYEHRSDIY